MGRSNVGSGAQSRSGDGAGGEALLSALIVDDDEEIRHALRLLLDLERIEVVGEATNGLEAVALAKQLEPEVIILDYLMPRMNGEEAAQLIRSVAPSAKIIAFSAMLDRQPSWADAYLNKDRIADVAPVIGQLIGLHAGSV